MPVEISLISTITMRIGASLGQWGKPKGQTGATGFQGRTDMRLKHMASSARCPEEPDDASKE